MKKLIFSLATLSFLAACNDDEESAKLDTSFTIEEPTSAELYTGGQLGTTFVITSSALSQPTPACEEQGLANAFKLGEYFFDAFYTIDNEPFDGLGPVYLRQSCTSCHPNYGHGFRQEGIFDPSIVGNAYLPIFMNAQGEIVASYSSVAHPFATAPFKPYFKEGSMNIAWQVYTDEWGNKFDDGETYELIYPEVSIAEEDLYLPLTMADGSTLPFEDLVITMESTIGVYGVGLLDAITEDDLKAQYISESEHAELNPAIWDNTAKDFAVRDANTNSPYKFDYALDRAWVQADYGLWETINCTRPDFRYIYATDAWKEVSAKDPDVQKDFYTYYPEWNLTGDVEKDITAFLNCDTFAIDMSEEDYINYMVWHRGIAVPAARNLDRDDVKLGRTIFNEIGCASCHRPSWTTGDDNYLDPLGRFAEGDSRLPRYPNQVIWPYTDLIQHRLCMQNDIRTGWCRTTPLWGRGLSKLVTGHSDRLHDCRARTVIEAIMWHGAANSDARWSIENFRKLNKTERDALAAFIDAI